MNLIMLIVTRVSMKEVKAKFKTAGLQLIGWEIHSSRKNITLKPLVYQVAFLCVIIFSIQGENYD